MRVYTYPDLYSRFLTYLIGAGGGTGARIGMLYIYRLKKNLKKDDESDYDDSSPLRLVSRSKGGGQVKEIATRILVV